MPAGRLDPQGIRQLLGPIIRPRTLVSTFYADRCTGKTLSGECQEIQQKDSKLNHLRYMQEIDCRGELTGSKRLAWRRRRILPACQLNVGAAGTGRFRCYESSVSDGTKAITFASCSGTWTFQSDYNHIWYERETRLIVENLLGRNPAKWRQETWPWVTSRAN